MEKLPKSADPDVLASGETQQPEGEGQTLHFDLGSFEGFNFRTCATYGMLTAKDVIAWNHDRDGEAEFWPAGDHPVMTKLFSGNVTASELVELDRLLDELGGDSEENFLRVCFSMNDRGGDIAELTAVQIEDEAPQIFFGKCFTDARKEAAYELFETYYPDLYRMWESTPCDGLIFDPDRFIDSPSWRVDEVRLGETRVAVLVAPQ